SIALLQTFERGEQVSIVLLKEVHLGGGIELGPGDGGPRAYSSPEASNSRRSASARLARSSRYARNPSRNRGDASISARTGVTPSVSDPLRSSASRRSRSRRSGR